MASEVLRKCNMCASVENIIIKEFVFSLMAPHIINITNDDTTAVLILSIQWRLFTGQKTKTFGKGPPAVGRENVHG